MASNVQEPELFVTPDRRIPKAFNAYDPVLLPVGTTREPIDVTAGDGAFSLGILHLPPALRGSMCAMFMHPRTQQTRPYLAPYLLDAGIAVWGQHSRHVNNDTDMTHEEVLLDVAAGMRMLRSRGFKQIALIGNSGGGSLLGAYQWQATTAPEDRMATDPSGEPTGFAAEDMPPADLFVALAAHQGEGLVLLDALDAAIVDEHDPVAVDPDLDIFSAANGYRPFPQESRYDPAFVDRYRAAQRARCARIDALARTALADHADARASSDPFDLTTPWARRATALPYLVVYGTCANPANLDLSIDPSDRPVGSLFANGNPFSGNSAPGGLARIVTPRAWLSTWSGLASRCELTYAIEHLDVPTLFVYPEADEVIFPRSQEDLLARCPADDLEMARLPHALHYLGLAPGAPDPYDPRAAAGEIVAEWLTARLA